MKIAPEAERRKLDEIVCKKYHTPGN